MEERRNALLQLYEAEDLSHEGVEKIVSEYWHSRRPTLSDVIREAMLKRPKFLAYRNKVKRVIEQVINFVAQFEDGFGETSNADGGVIYMSQLNSSEAADFGRDDS